MDTGFSELQIFISLVVVLGTAFVALVVDYLKGNNERLREYNVELRTRREENDRVRPLEAVQWLQNLLQSNRPKAAMAPAAPAPLPEVNHAAEPVIAKPPAVRRETVRRRRPEPAAAVVIPEAVVQPPPAPAPSLLESLPTPEWVEQEREAANQVAVTLPLPEPVIAKVEVAEAETAPAPPEPVLEPLPEPEPPVAIAEAPAAEAAAIEIPVVEAPVIPEPVIEEPEIPEPIAPVEKENVAEPVAELPELVAVPPAAAAAVEPVTVTPPPVVEPEPVPVVAEEPKRETFWTYRGLLDRVVAEQEQQEPALAVPVAAPPPSPKLSNAIAAEPEPELVIEQKIDQPPPVKSPLSKWASRLQSNRGMKGRNDALPVADSSAGRQTPSWVDRALQKEAARAVPPEPVIETPEPVAPPIVEEAPAVAAQPVPEPEPVASVPEVPALLEEPAAPAPIAEEPSTQQPVAQQAAVIEEVVMEEAVVNVPEPAIVEFVAAEQDAPVLALEPEPEPLPEAAPEPPAPVVAPEPEALRVPSGYHDRSVLTSLMQSSDPISGVLVAIGINDYQTNIETMGRQAMHDLMRSVEQMIRSLLREEDFACRSNDDEFILFFPNETGSAAQRRLTAISERLWSFQLRSLSSFSVLFSWGAVETQGDTLADAVASASERMYQTKRNRKGGEQRRKLAV